MKSNYLIELGTVTDLQVYGKNKKLCTVEIIDQIEEDSRLRLQVKTFWERRDGGISLMRLYPSLMYIIGDKIFKSVYSKVDIDMEQPYNTILEYVNDVNVDCDRTFYDDKCIVGCGKYSPSEHHEIYKSWLKLIDLVYSEVSKRNSNYSLFSEWHSFQSFAYWYEENFPKEKSPFGKYMMVYDLGHSRSIELNPKTVLFVEVHIMKFPKSYTYALETPSVYSMSVNEGFRKAKGYKDYTVLYYSYETERVETLGTFNTLEEARQVYLLHLSNKKTKMLNYLKSKGDCELEPLINKFERL